MPVDTISVLPDQDRQIVDTINDYADEFFHQMKDIFVIRNTDRQQCSHMKHDIEQKSRVCIYIK